mgnify:CR=1 FL=1
MVLASDIVPMRNGSDEILIIVTWYFWCLCVTYLLIEIDVLVCVTELHDIEIDLFDLFDCWIVKITLWILGFLSHVF